MPSTPAEIFSEINSRIAADPAKTAGMNAVYAFDLNGEAPGQYHISLKDGTADVGEGVAGESEHHDHDEIRGLRRPRHRQARRDHGVHERQDQDQGRHGAGDEAPVGAPLGGSPVRARWPGSPTRALRLRRATSLAADRVVGRCRASHPVRRAPARVPVRRVQRRARATAAASARTRISIRARTSSRTSRWSARTA